MQLHQSQNCLEFFILRTCVVMFTPARMTAIQAKRHSPVINSDDFMPDGGQCTGNSKPEIPCAACDHRLHIQTGARVTVSRVQHGTRQLTRPCPVRCLNFLWYQRLCIASAGLLANLVRAPAGRRNSCIGLIEQPRKRFASYTVDPKRIFFTPSAGASRASWYMKLK